MFTVANDEFIPLVPEALTRSGRVIPFPIGTILTWELDRQDLGSLVVAEDTLSANFVTVDGAVGDVIVTARMGDLVATENGSVVNPQVFSIRITAGTPGPR